MIEGLCKIIPLHNVEKQNGLWIKCDNIGKVTREVNG